MTAGDADPPAAPEATWTAAGKGGGWTLALAGDWRTRADAPAVALPALPDDSKDAPLAIDAGRLQGWDAAFVAKLWQLLQALPRQRIALDGLPASLRALLELALPDAAPAATPAKAAPSRPGRLAQVGRFATAHGAKARRTLEFLGEVLLSFGRLARGRAQMRRRDLLWQIDQAGPRSVPIVSLVSALSGLILGYMGAAQLQRFGAQSYIADLVTVGGVREMAALMTGVILSGRIGAAYAAQLGSMQANEETDALRALGVDPVDYLVLPRVLAMLIVAPLLIAYAALVMMAAGGAIAVVAFGVPAAEYLSESRDALTLPHVLIGLLKGTVYAVLVVLAGCRQGLDAGRSAQAVGQATTAAVVQAIVWIVAAASALTVAFQKLGW